MNFNIKTVIAIQGLLYLSKIPLLLAPLETMATASNQERRLFFLQHSEDTNEKEIDRLKTAINIRETTNRFGAVVFALPTPLDIFYGTYRGIRALRKYFSAREEVPETRYNC